MEAVVHRLVPAFLAIAVSASMGCGGPTLTSSSGDAPTLDAASPTPDSGMPTTPVTPDAGCTGGGTTPCGTPIAWAETWVAGFYGSPQYQATNRYSNTDTAGFPDGYYTQWRGDPGVTLFGNVSDCSSFSDGLLSRSYAWLPPTANPRPLADDYYWTIRGSHGFSQITTVGDIQVGDVIVLLYAPGGADTGHVAWIDALPQAFDGAPEEAGLSQFVVTVIDSTNGFHDGQDGPTPAADDRYLGRLTNGDECTSDTQCITLYGPNAQCNSTQLISDSVCALSGIGKGQMRLFADSSGTIQGHTWSPNAESTFYPRPNPLPTQGGTFVGEDILVGRYVPSP
jgi:hypothetical protein